MAIARSLSQLFSRPTSRGGSRRQGARRNPAANRPAMVMESLEKRAMLAVSYVYTGSTETLAVVMTGSGNASHIEFGVTSGGTALGARFSSSSTPSTDNFSPISHIYVTAPAGAADNRMSFGIIPFSTAFDNASFVFEGYGNTSSGFFACEVGAGVLLTSGLNLTNIDVISFAQADEIRLDGTFSNSAGNATVQVAYQSFEPGVTEVILGTNAPLVADNIRVESSKAITMFNPIVGSNDVVLRSSAPLEINYDITAGKTLVLDGDGGILQAVSSTILAPVLEVVNRANVNDTGNVELSSAKNDFDEIHIQSFTSGDIAIRDCNDLVIAHTSFLAAPGDLIVQADGLLTIDGPVKSAGFKAYSGVAINTTKRGTLTIGDGGIDLTARAVATSATGDITLNGRVEIGSNSLPAVVINNSIRSDGVITIAGGFYAPQGGATLVEGLAGVLVASPVQVGHTFVDATSTAFVVTDADLTLVSSSGFVDILDFSGNAAIPQAVQVTNMLSIDAFADIFIDGQVFVGTRYGNVIDLVETVALPNIFIRGQADITIGQTGQLETSSYETDADLHVNPLVGAIKIVDATQFTNFGRIVADGALEIDIRGDIYLTGGIAARESIFATTSLGIIDVQGAVEATGFSYTTSPPAPLEVRRVPNITLAAPAGSITTSTLGTLRAGTAVIAAGEVAIEAHGQITLAAQQDVIIGAAIDTKGAVDVSSKIGAIEIDALVRTANEQPVRLAAAEGIESFEFGRIVTKRLEATNTTAFDVKLGNPDNRIDEFEAFNLAAGGNVTGYTNSTVTLQRIQAVGDINFESSQTMTVRGQIGSTDGDISLTSAFGGASINSNIIADNGEVTIKAAGEVLQRGGSIETILLTSEGRNYKFASATVEPPPGAGLPALVRAGIIPYPRPPFDGVIGRVNPVFLLLDPGWGYFSGQRVRVIIDGDGEGAVAWGIASIVSSSIEGAAVVEKIGEGVTLVNDVRSANGNVEVIATRGDIGVKSITAPSGDVLVAAERGKIVLETVSAGGGVELRADQGVEVRDAANAGSGDLVISSRNDDLDFAGGSSILASTSGSVLLTASNGAIRTPPIINAGADVTLKSFSDLLLNNLITSQAGTVTAESISAGIALNSDVKALDGSVVLASQGDLVVPSGGGVTSVLVISRGNNYSPQTFLVFAPPANPPVGVTPYPAYGRPIINNGELQDIVLVSPGVGYQPGEQVLITITDPGTPGGNGAVAIGLVSLPLQSIYAKQDVLVDVQGSVLFTGRVFAEDGSVIVDAIEGVRSQNSINSVGGDVIIRTLNRDLDFSDANSLVASQLGSVELVSQNGGVLLPPVLNAFVDIDIRTFAGLVVTTPLANVAGDVVLQSSGSSVILNDDVISANSLAISAKTGITQAVGLVKAANLTLDNLTATPIVVASGGNDVDRFAAKNVGAVTFADANDFRVGISSVGPMGVEVSGSTVNLSAGGTIRVVAGIDTQGLTITAGSVEFVTTNAGDNPGQQFAGTLRDMIAVSNQNLDRQTPQAMVFDEQLVDGSGNPLPAVGTITVGTASLPAFTRPITFDGSRVLPTAPGGRLGLLGRSGLPSGLHLGLGSSRSRITGAAVFGFTTGSGVIVESGNNTVDNMYVGLRPNGVTVSPNRLGVNVSGVQANSNTIGTVMYNSLTDGVVSTLRVTNRGEQAANSTPNVIVTIAPPVGGGTAATAQAVVEEIRPGLYGLTGLVLTNPGSGYEIGENPAITFAGMPGASAVSIVAIQTKANHFTGNSDAAIVVQRGASNNLIAGNVVGVPGRAPNRTGVRIDGGSGNQVGTAAQTTDDLTPTPSNLIRGNTHYGVEIRNVRGATTVVENNIVAHNVVREGQGVHGVGVLNSMNVRIGGVSELAANQIHSQTHGAGVHLSGSTNVAIVGNHIGTDGYHLTANGHFPDAVPVWPDMGGGLGNSPFMGNGRHGIDVFGRSRDVEITANRIVDNRGSGVAIASGSSGVVLTRNEIGAWVHPVTGNIHAAGNLADGVTITAANGNTVGSGNVIGFNKGSGVHVENSVAAGLATGNRVAGAEIFGNSGHGVNVSGSSRQTIGGAGGDDGNIIKENLLDGIRLGADPRVRASAAPHGNLVSGNFVGTNDNEEIDRNWGNRNGISVIDGVSNVLSRNTVMNNRDSGIEIAGGVGNTVGGQTTNEGNFIGYNLSDGVFIHDNASTRRDVGVNGTVITAQGAGYAASRTNVIFTAPAVEGGVPARGVALVSADGRVTGIRLTSSGSGYTMGELVSVTIFDPLATASATATVTLGTIQAISSISRGHVVSGNEIEANAGAGVHVMGDRTTEVQVGQNPDNLRNIGAANKISFHLVGVLVNAAMRTRVQGNVYGDNDSPLELINGANDRMHGTQTEVLDLRSTQMGIGQTLVTGELVNGGAFHQYSIDVYDTPYWDISYDSNGVPSGHQMRRFLGRALVTTDGFGRATISMTISQAMELGDYVSVKVTSTRYEPGTTVGVFHSEHRHRTPLMPTPSPNNPTPTPTPGTATPPSGSSGTTGQIPTPPRGSVPPSRL